MTADYLASFEMIKFARAPLTSLYLDVQTVFCISKQIYQIEPKCDLTFFLPDQNYTFHNKEALLCMYQEYFRTVLNITYTDQQPFLLYLCTQTTDHYIGSLFKLHVLWMRVSRFVIVQNIKMRRNIPNDHKMYQMGRNMYTN
jgi:hypothetical protein